MSCKNQTNKTKDITIVPTTTNTLSSSSSSSSIKCVSPNVVAGSNNNSYVVFEAIYYDNGSNGVQNHTNHLVLAKMKNNHTINDKNATKNETNHVAPPILVTSVSTPLTSVLQCNNSTTATASTNGGFVKKPSIILLTQSSLSKLLSVNDLNVINNNSNTNTTNHSHSHQHDNNIRNKCNLVINTTNSNTQPNNNHLTSDLMINSTSTIETTAGVVTLTPATGLMSSATNRDANDEISKNSNQQVKIQYENSLAKNAINFLFPFSNLKEKLINQFFIV